ncbi:arginine--tRNA ligase [Mycoplasma parvum]|uniref:Arginine--tRNA ligase n=1 Tax=Mycoplasma parvum str. Indiana TaxID=1403316 RepID=U5NCE5_9MOLU|nr:arginine--tRNA ligase [Mycoplasma parvum]AGX88990.1 arginyl-tRNA synthetase [Mycoplasma parvum str. Indiana]
MILTLKEQLKEALREVLVKKNFTLLLDKIELEESKNSKFGFFSTNLPFLISSTYKKNIEESEQLLLDSLNKHEEIPKIEAVQGYLNFFISSNLIKNFYKSSLKRKKIIAFSNNEENKKTKYFIEIVSANPTGILHIGHIRNGVITDTLSNILEYNNNSVFRAYLINDAGTQIEELIKSIHTFYSFISKGASINLMEHSIKYSGNEIRDCAQAITEKFGHYWELDNEELTQKIKLFAVEFFVNLIKKELDSLSIKVDNWDYESKKCSESALTHLIKKLQDFIYLKDNALWFKTSSFKKEGDEKDDVIVKSDGNLSYFGQDLIYHLYKLEFLGTNGIIINTLAEDHKGHIDRMKAFFSSINVPESLVKYKTTKLSRLIVDGKKIVFSKRENIFLSSEELKEHLSKDEIRWFLCSRDEENELDIDLSKLNNKDYNNPIFYILYAYSRALKITEKINFELDGVELSFEKLDSEIEQSLINSILAVEFHFQKAIQNLKVHIISNYLYSLAKKFHTFYESFSIINDSNRETQLARLALVQLVLRIFKEFLPLFRIVPTALA